MAQKIGNVKLYNTKEISELLGLSELSVRKYLREGKIKAKKIGAKWRVTNQDLREYILSHDN